MAVQLDHIFCFVSVGAPEAGRLSALGFTEGRPNQHLGQGTACRRFFFANVYLELLWVADPAEVQGNHVRRLRFWERWSQRAQGTCPFGLIFRCGAPDESLPFPTWEYQPAYFPPPQCLHIGVNSDCIQEPLLVCYRGSSRPDSRPTESRQPLDHPAGLREVTALRIFSPDPAGRSEVMSAAEQTGAVTFLPGSAHLAELGFDGERQGQRADLSPALPLVICW